MSSLSISARPTKDSIAACTIIYSNIHIRAAQYRSKCQEGV